MYNASGLFDVEKIRRKSPLYHKNLQKLIRRVISLILKCSSIGTLGRFMHQHKSTHLLFMLEEHCVVDVTMLKGCSSMRERGPQHFRTSPQKWSWRVLVHPNRRELWSTIWNSSTYWNEHQDYKSRDPSRSLFQASWSVQGSNKWEYWFFSAEN